MGVLMSELPLAPCERILRKAGAERVSKGAVEEFAKVLDDVATGVAAEAAVMARHAGRKTIMDADVRFARKKLE